MELEEDKILYKEFLAGNNLAFDTLMGKYRTNLVYFIFKYVRSLDVAEDIFQDVMLYVLEKKEQYNFDYSFKAYLYMIAKSRAINYVKEHQKRNIVGINESTFVEEKLLEDIVENKERKNTLSIIINGLSPEYKMVVYLCMIEELSYEEAGAIMGKTVGQIKNLVHRARVKLRKKLLEEKLVEIRNNKTIKLFVSILILIFITASVVYAITNYMNNKKRATLTPSFIGEVSNMDFNTLWIGSFQLAWNELKDIEGQDIEFEEDNTKLLEALNKSTFSKDMISEDSYYVKVGKTTENLKNEIENDLLKRNFNNDLLDRVDFSEDFNSYTLYSIINKEFEFLQPFDRLPDNYFGDNREQKVKYFGVNTDSDTKLLENFEIIFHDNNESFAVKLLTKTNEELLLLKTEQTGSFSQLYAYLEENTKKYDGRKELQEGDTLYVPYIEIDTIINYDELCGKFIKGTKGAYIQSALQNAKFYLNEKGGKLSSEASVVEATLLAYMYPLDFDFNSTFYIFMKEKDKVEPYMALKVDNIDILVEEG